MDLWKNLDKITAQLQNSPAKVLMLDFDGTLTPIVKSPDQAELSKSMRHLLSRLGKKQGVYLAILSGRELKDIKKKIGLPNIIYGSNHGLEGEFFGEKYSFPIPQKKLAVLKDIRGQLNKIANQFEGVFIEDKRLTVSLHYRLANKQQVPEIKLLINQILKPYIKEGLVFTIAGKKVIDITPNVNWNKGSFAKLVINRTQAQTKASPVAIFVGDDKTDEDVFQKLKRGTTIKVGDYEQSKAKYRLTDTNDVFRFLEWINVKF